MFTMRLYDRKANKTAMLHLASGHETVQRLTLDAPEPMRALQTMLWLKMLSPTTFRRLPGRRCSLTKDFNRFDAA